MLHISESWIQSKILQIFFCRTSNLDFKMQIHWLFLIADDTSNPDFSFKKVKQSSSYSKKVLTNLFFSRVNKKDYPITNHF